MKQNIALLVLACSLICSCTIKKRHYRKGFYIETKKSEVALNEDSKEETKRKNSQQTYFASSDDKVFIPNKKEEFIHNSIDTTICSDTIFLKKGNYIVCKILENETHHIKYIKCPKLDDSFYYIEKDKILRLSNQSQVVQKKPETQLNQEKEIDPFAIISAASGLGAIVSAFSILTGVFCFFPY
jgi:hypothetical protein